MGRIGSQAGGEARELLKRPSPSWSDVYLGLFKFEMCFFKNQSLLVQFQYQLIPWIQNLFTFPVSDRVENRVTDLDP